MATTPSELRAAALAVASGLDPDTMSGAVAARAVADLAVAEKAVATARMFVALRVAKTDAWRGQGHKSAADWLAAQCGITVTEAHHQLGTAQKAKKLSKTKKAMDEGKLSPTQAGAVTQGASADPDAEDDLLSSAANDTTKNLKDKAARARAAATDSRERNKRIRRERCLRMRTDADGAFNLWLRGPAIDGARLQAMLKPFQQEAFRAARSRWSSDAVKDTFDNRQYDAFFDLLDHLGTLAGITTHLTGTPTAQSPGTTPHPTTNTPRHRAANADEAKPTSPPGAGSAHPPASTPRPGDPPDASEPPDPHDPECVDPRDGMPGTDQTETLLTGLSPTQLAATRRKLPGGNNTKVIINIDLAALRRGHTLSGETCHIDGLGPIPVETARQLMDDAFIAAVIRDGTHIHTVTHLGRSLSTHQRTAIEATGIRCTNIACNQTIAIQIDHRTPWSHHPTTELANQDPLCPHCHRQKTHHGWHLEEGTGPRRLLAPKAPAMST